MTAFAEVEKVGSLLRDLRCPWFICGGWALDLFLGRATRAHKDVDIGVAREDQFTAREYLRRRGWKLDKAVGGELRPWADGERLDLPVHAVWCRNEAHDPDFIEILLNEIDGERFRFRRDQSITLARGRMCFEPSPGLHVLAPEIVLLYASNRHEEYDADFRNAAASLSDEARAWLRAALNKLSARHPWAARL
jgi:Aminoglycoside-2''-adenylyltransferase